MFESILKWCLSHRAFTLIITAIVSVWWAVSLTAIPVDVLPDLSRPRVTVFADAEGWAPEEMESLVALPIERAMGGAPWVIAVRSSSTLGLSIINVEFDWGTDVYKNRQIITEKLASLALPEQVHASMGPNASILSETQWVAVTSPDSAVDPLKLRSIADWQLRPQLLAIPWISDVIVMGGDPKQYQVLIDPVKARARGITIEQVIEAVGDGVENRGGGFILENGKEAPIRILARTPLSTEIAKIVVGRSSDGAIVSVEDIAEVIFAPDPNRRGDATVDGKAAVLLRIIKQNEANTLDITDKVDAVVESLKTSVPKGTVLRDDIFRQEWFINAGLSNVEEALRDSIIMVAIIVTLFLMNVRATLVTLVSLPLSLLVTFIIFRYLGTSINVMTLGGLAVAVGELVDDAIVWVENVFRRLRENALKAPQDRKRPIRVVFEATTEVRSSIVYATILVVIVFVPLLFLPDVDGKLLAEVGTAYIISLLASFVVSITAVPVLAAYLFPAYAEKFARANVGKRLSPDRPGYEADDTRFIVWVKSITEKPITWSIRHPRFSLMIGLGTLIPTLLIYLFLGKAGLPEFNEPTYTLGMYAPVGSSLATTRSWSDTVAAQLLAVKGISTVGSTMGRADGDAHANSANVAEFEIHLDTTEREKNAIRDDILTITAQYEGQLLFSLGQPITHRIQELASGVRAPIVLKLYGSDLDELRTQADRILSFIKGVDGVVNAQIERELKVPQLSIAWDRNAARGAGVSIGDASKDLESALLGKSVAEVLDGSERYPLIVKYDPSSGATPESVASLIVSEPYTAPVPLGQVAVIERSRGQNTVSHDNGQRRLVISAFPKDRDVVSIVEEIRTGINGLGLPSGYFVSYEGDFKTQQESSRRLMIIALLIVVAVFGVLYWQFRSAALVGQILLGVATAFLWGMLAVLLGGGVMTTAHLIGFISLIGIVSRNGIMLVSHYLHLIREGREFNAELVVQGSLERVVPVLMTALAAASALIPLVLAGDATGKEMLHPLATVIFGGLIVSTILEVFVRPGVFWGYGQYGVKKALHDHGDEFD